MSESAHPDDIDELLSSVRDFVSHKEPHRTRSRILHERLLLTPDQRVPDDVAQEVPVIVDPNSDVVQSNVHVLNNVKSFDKVGLEATIAELEAAVTAQSDDWEADEGESFADAAWAASAFETPPSDSTQAEQPQPEAPKPRSFPIKDAFAEPAKPVVSEEAPMPADPLVGIDEAALRSLVVKIVHEELSGALGERITRNVRKLVRREINRVLTSRDMGQD